MPRQFPLKWHGGKQPLAKWIISMMPRHKTFVEPYGGGLAVLLNKPPGTAEVVNDINGLLMNFWRCLKDEEKFNELAWMSETTPFCKASFDEAKEILEGSVDQYSAVERAWAFFVVVRMSRQGLCQGFATMSKARTRRGMNEQAASWLSAVECLPEAHERLRSVVLESDHALNVIDRWDHTDTFFYLDPPYVHGSRVSKDSYGPFEMTEMDHESLLTRLQGLQGKFMLSGYNSELYTAYAKRSGWYRTQKHVKNHASSAGEKPSAIEMIWTNYITPKGV